MNKEEILNKIAPYIPYDIQVEYQVGERKGDCILDAGAFAEIQYDEDVTHIKPHLRDFSQLTESIVESGREITPALEIMCLATNSLLEDARISVIHKSSAMIILSTSSDGQEIELLIPDEFDIALRVDDEFMPIHNQYRIVDALRSMHFALGFKESEYTAIGIGAARSKADSPDRQVSP